MSTITDLLEAARPLDEKLEIVAFARDLYRLAVKHSGKVDISRSLAALFDVSVTALYLQNLGANGWLYCRQGRTNPKLYYPFVNACPGCLLRNEFVFTRSRKPRSAIIGQATSLILTTFLNEHCKSASKGACEVKQLGGNGTVDALAVEGSKVCLFEIKSAPLITFPVEADTEIMTMTSDTGEEIEPIHSGVTLPPDYRGNLKLIISEKLRIPIGRYGQDRSWPYKQLTTYFSDLKNFKQYVEQWSRIYGQYAGQEEKSSIYWLTNGCGQPVPRPKGWPARTDGTGYESVSDGKSSVGLDRTDDIKKGIYQVLKIGTHYKEFETDKNFSVYTLLASNIHAIKHHQDYLKEFEDMMWTIDSKERTYIASRNEKITTIRTEGLHNLYDGLVTFTESHFRSQWVKDRFSF